MEVSGTEWGRKRGRIEMVRHIIKSVVWVCDCGNEMTDDGIGEDNMLADFECSKCRKKFKFDFDLTPLE